MLDNGCIYFARPGMGRLAALELESMTVTYQENIDL
jgi:serine/threonine protein phosphatase 1